MINNQIDKLIMEAMKSHENVRKEALRAIKAAFLLWRTQKENVNKPFTDEVEIQILKKMVKQRQESIEQFTAAGRQDLADAEAAQVVILKEFLPADVTKEQIVKTFENLMAIGADAWHNMGYLPLDKKYMGVYIKELKRVHPSADGKLVAEVVQDFLKK